MRVPIIIQSLLEPLHGRQIVFQLRGYNQVVVCIGAFLQYDLVTLRNELNNIGFDLIKMTLLRGGEHTLPGRSLVLKALMCVEILRELVLEQAILVRDKCDWFMYVLLTEGSKHCVGGVSECA
jgi:hypothetical protein